MHSLPRPSSSTYGWCKFIRDEREEAVLEVLEEVLKSSQFLCDPHRSFFLFGSMLEVLLCIRSWLTQPHSHLFYFDFKPKFVFPRFESRFSLAFTTHVAYMFLCRLLFSWEVVIIFGPFRNFLFRSYPYTSKV